MSLSENRSPTQEQVRGRLFPGHALFKFHAGTLDHISPFFPSDAMNVEKSCGDPTSGSEPSLARPALMPADISPSLVAALSLVTMASGVPAGATSPFQTVN